MYYEEIYDENIINGSESNDGSMYKYNTFSSNSKHKQQTNNSNSDRYLRTVKNLNKTWVDGNYYTKVNIVQHGSTYYIRNAVTGEMIDKSFRVGSNYEDLFFVVNDATGRNHCKEPMRLFYDSPEQFENHQFQILSQNVKRQWNIKNMVAKATYKKMMEKKKSRVTEVR